MRRFEFHQLIPVILLLTWIIGIPALIYLAVAEANAWAEFSEEHECQVVGRMSGSVNTGTGVGVTTTGEVGSVFTTTYTPSKTGYLCNDGVTYWR